MLKIAEEPEQNLLGDENLNETLYDLSAMSAFLFQAMSTLGNTGGQELGLTALEADGAQKLGHIISEKLLYLSERV